MQPKKVTQEVKLDRAEMSLIRWTREFTLKLVFHKGRLRWLGHTECTDDAD